MMTATTAATSAGTLPLVLALLFLLILKEILSAAAGRRAQVLSRVLNIAILPLLVSFVFIAIVKVAQVVN